MLIKQSILNPFLQVFSSWCFFSNFVFFNLYIKFFLYLTCFSKNFIILKNSTFNKKLTKNINVSLKKKLCYFLLLSGSLKLHWKYNSLIISKSIKPVVIYNFNLKFLTNQLNILLNLFNKILLCNGSFFIFNFDFLLTDIYALSKYVFGVKNVLKYNFIFDYDIKKFRNYKWRSRFTFFVKKKRVKITFLLDIYNGFFFVDYLKSLKVITVGLLPQTMTPQKLDFWFLLNNNSYLIKYLFFSFIHSMYNVYLTQKMLNYLYFYNKKLFNYMRLV